MCIRDRFVGHLADNVLDPARLNAAVADQRFQRLPRDFAADWIEAGYRNRFRRVVDDQIDAGRLFDRLDVAALAADDPALHFLGRQTDDGNRPFNRFFLSITLNRQRDDIAGGIRSFGTCLIFPFADINAEDVYKRQA